jgi:aminoglycoside 6'-N-acetyltransferase
VAADLSAFQAYRHDEKVGQYQSWDPMSDQDASAFIAGMSNAALFPRGRWVQIGIADVGTGMLIGDLGICVSPDGGAAEIGVTLDRAAQGKGFAADALRAVIELIFDHAGVARISAAADARNVPAVRLLERVGMQRVETVAAMFRGQPCVEHIYELLSDRR